MHLNLTRKKYVPITEYSDFVVLFPNFFITDEFIKRKLPCVYLHKPSRELK